MIRKVLEEIFYHGIMPREKCRPHKKEYRQLSKKSDEAERELLEMVAPDTVKTFERYRMYMSQINTLEEEEHFIQGFSLGMRLTAEAFLTGMEEEKKDNLKAKRKRYGFLSLNRL